MRLHKLTTSESSGLLLTWRKITLRDIGALAMQAVQIGAVLAGIHYVSRLLGG